MLIDPWGEIVAVRDEGAGVVIGNLQRARIDEVRQSLPAWRHRVLSLLNCHLTLKVRRLPLI